MHETRVWRAGIQPLYHSSSSQLSTSDNLYVFVQFRLIRCRVGRRVGENRTASSRFARRPRKRQLVGCRVDHKLLPEQEKRQRQGSRCAIAEWGRRGGSSPYPAAAGRRLRLGGGGGSQTQSKTIQIHESGRGHDPGQSARRRRNDRREWRDLRLARQPRQCCVGFATGNVSSIWRRARVQARTRACISVSAIRVMSRT